MESWTQRTWDCTCRKCHSTMSCAEALSLVEQFIVKSAKKKLEFCPNEYFCNQGRGSSVFRRLAAILQYQI